MINKNKKKEINVNDNNLRQKKITSYKIINNQNKNKSYNLRNMNKFYVKGEDIFNPNNNDVEKLFKFENGKDDINNIFFNEYEKNNINNYYISSDEEDNNIQKQIEKKKQNSSFELISLNENNSNKEEEDEDNFDDMNSIIKKINFDKEENIVNDIFSLENNKKYNKFQNIFDKRFDKWIHNIYEY